MYWRTIQIKYSRYLLRIILISLASGFYSIKAQTVNPEPTISINISSERAPIYQRFDISWKCVDPSSTVPQYQLQTRYKLDVPGDWIGGIKYNINKWTEYKDGINDNLSYSDFIIEGNYRISVQCRNKMTGKESRIFSKTFTLFWEYPEMQQDAFIIDWEKADNAKSQQERNQILAEEYKKAYIMWDQKYQYQVRLLKTTMTAQELADKYIGAVGEEVTQNLIVGTIGKSATQTIIQKWLLPFLIYDLIKLGTTDLILVMRNYEANKAFTMTLANYLTWKELEKLAEESKSSKNSEQRVSSGFFKPDVSLSDPKYEMITNNANTPNPTQLVCKYTWENKEVIVLITQSPEIWNGQMRMHGMIIGKKVTGSAFQESLTINGYKVFATGINNSLVQAVQAWVLLEDNFLAIVTLSKGGEIRENLKILNFNNFVPIYHKVTNH